MFLFSLFVWRVAIISLTNLLEHAAFVEHLFDPLKPTLLQLVAPVSRGNILTTCVLSIQLLTSFLLSYSSTDALNSPSHLITHLWVPLRKQSPKNWHQWDEGLVQGMVAFPSISVFSMFSRFSVAPDHQSLLHFFLGLYSLYSESSNHNLHLRGTDTVLVQ